jgi:recombination protein RecT
MEDTMSLPAQTRQLSPVEHYTRQVIGDERHEADLWSALPDHVKPERFKRNMVNLFMQKPEMLHYDPRAVFCEVSKAAALGLLLDPQLGEAYIVPVWNPKAGGKVPELRCGYRGIMKLARQSDEISNLYPGEVRKNDVFKWTEGTNKQLIHEPAVDKPRGSPTHYYAVVQYKDGNHDFEVMDMHALHDIRERSDSWKAFKAGKIKSTPWDTDEGEMCKKTVLRRLLKRVPQSPELSEALGMENAADFAPNAPRLAPPPSRKLHAVETSHTTIDAHVEEDFEGDPDAPALVSAEQVEQLVALADEVGADKAKFCQWLGVSIFSEIPASEFDRAVRALEAKRRQAEDARGHTKEQASQPFDATGTKITSAAAPSSAAETPADPPAGAPASSDPPTDDAGIPSQAELKQEAWEAGRSACENGVDFKDIPEKYRNHAFQRKAWKDGYQAFAAEAGA